MSPDPEHPALEALRARLREEEAAYAEVLAAVDRLAAFAAPGRGRPGGPRAARAAERALGGPRAPRGRRAGRRAPAARVGRRRPGARAAGGVQRRPRPAAERLPRPGRRPARAPARARRRARALRPAGAAPGRRPRPRGHRPRHHPLRARARGLRPAARVARPAARGPARPARPAGGGVGGGARAARLARAAAPPPRGRGRRLARGRGLGLHRVREPLPRQPRGDPGAPRRVRGALRGRRPRRRPGLRAGRVPARLLRRARASPPGASRATRTWCGSAARRASTCVEGDLVDFLRAQADGSLGGVFAAQVAEHLPPPVLVAMLRRGPPRAPSGRPAAARDGQPPVGHGPPRGLQPRPHPRAPAPPGHPALPRRGRGLHRRAGRAADAGGSRTPSCSRCPRTASRSAPPRVLNENVERLNALLYGPLEYALVARR